MNAERTFLRSRSFITYAMKHAVVGFAKELSALYVDPNGPQLLTRAIMSGIQVCNRSKAEWETKQADSKRRVSLGALHPLRRDIAELIEIVALHRPDVAKLLQDYANGGCPNEELSVFQE